MNIPSSPSPSPHIAPTPSPTTPPLDIAPTLQPLSQPVIDLMSSAAMPAVTFIPPELAGPTQQSHAQSDCGHYGSPQLKRSHSLLRNFSLRSRNSFSPRTHQNQAPTDSASSTASGSSLLSVWKKWRVKSLSTLDGRDGEPAHHPMSCPQGPAKKRSLFLHVSRLIAPFQIPSSTPLSDDLPCPQSPSIPLIQQESVRLSNLNAIQDEDNNKVNADGIVELIRQIDGCVPDVGMESQTHCKTDPELTIPDMSPPLPSPPLTPSSPPLLTPSSLNSLPSSSTPSSSLCSPPFPPLPSSLPPTDSSTSPPLPVLHPIPHPPNPPSPNVNSGRPPLSIPESNSQSSPNLKPSISQKRRAKFTLGDGLDLDCDSVAVARAPSLKVAEPVVLPNDSTDQVGLTSSAGTATATTTNGKITRRWTLSSALTDEGISDEGLVKELERMREVLDWDCTPIDEDGHDFPSSSPPPSPSYPSNPWLITQRALLTTRELILTERHYLSSLLLLLCPDSTLTPVPEMMVSLAKQLVDVSKRLLKGMEGEPSVRGVAEIFAEVGGGGLGVDGAESAFAGWCGVVGGWFQDELADAQAVVDVKTKRKSCEIGVGGGGGEYDSEHEAGGVTFPTSTTTGEHPHTSPLMRTVSTWRKSMASVTGPGEGGVWRRDRDKDRDRDRDKVEGGFTYGRGRIAFDEVRSSSSMSMSIGKPIRKPAVRDLAILPTQRVTRYVLLYRDLLANTPPSSSSYPIVERAVEAACRIAEKCNRAQGNTAFVADGSTRDSSWSSGSSTSMLNSSSSSRGRRFSGKRVMTVPERPTSGQGSTRQSSSATSSPTKSYFLLSSSPVSTSPSTSSLLLSAPSSLSRPASPTKIRPLLSPPPPSSFNSKIPIARSRLSFGLSTSAGSSTTTTTSGTSSSSSSSSSSSFLSLSTPLPLFLPKSTSSSSSNVSPQVPKPLSLMSLANGFGRGRNVSGGPAADGTGGADALTKGYASAIPTKIKDIKD